MKARFALILAAAVAALAIAGCGGGGDDSGSTDPATVAPSDSLFFLEATRPEGKATANVEALAEKIAGIGDLGEFIVSELESSALDSGGKLDYAKEVEPWLGKKAAFFPSGYDGDDFSEGGAVLQTTDPGEAEEFIEKKADEADEPVNEESYEGVDYYVSSDDGSAIGVIGNFVAYGEDKRTFEAMVDASNGESLADQASYASAVSSLPDGSVADVWVDIGGVAKASGGAIDPETKTGLAALGIDPEGATAVASAIPGTDQIEIDLSSDVLTEPPPAGDTSTLLGSLPADSVAAVSSPEAGAAFLAAVDRLDREGIPQEELPPHKLKSLFKEAGVDLDSIGSSIGDFGAFLEGNSRSSLGGAAVLITYGEAAAKNTVADVGLFLRATGTPGVTALSGKIDGFSIRDPSLGPKPLVVAAVAGDHIVVAYGLHAVTRYLYDAGEELADDPVFKEATASLDGTPISGFARGHAALQLASALISPEQKEGFRKAKRYLTKIDFLALGSESTDDLAKAKLIVGIGK